VRQPQAGAIQPVEEVCARLAGVTKLTREEMRLAGYPDGVPEIDACRDPGRL